MLDKLIERLRVILKRNPGTPLPPVCLPQGYAFVSYQEGDEQAWAEIETSAGTFDTVEDAVAYFRQTFVPYLEEVKRRTFFLQKVANFTAWWGYTGKRRYPFMRWVSIKSHYQRLGLGKAMIAEGVRRMDLPRIHQTEMIVA